MSSTTPTEHPSAPSFARRYGDLVAVLAAALFVRVQGLSVWWLNPDEGIYYSILTRAESAGFWQEVTSNAHPPLYYLLLRALGSLTWDFLWLRALSVVCGLGVVVAVWAVARSLSEGRAARTVAGLTAGTLIALSPAAIELSQVMRPYMLQLALLAGALFFLLRYRETASPRSLGVYVALTGLALLTHYSSVLALGVFGLVVLYDGAESGFASQRFRTLVLAQAIPAALVVGLYFFHLRPLAASALADDALDGWLSFYMVRTPTDAWWAFLGLQHLTAGSWLRGATALFLAAAIGTSLWTGHRLPGVLAGGALAVGVVAASLGVYPFGSTRHSAWTLAFTVPAIGWLAGRLFESARSGGARLVPAAAIAVIAFGGPLGSMLGVPLAPWAPPDQVLRRDHLATMVDVLDPTIAPDLMVMSAQTFYLLLPFYPSEREAATFSVDGALFHFRYGERDVLVSQAWDFSAGADRAAPGHLGRVLSAASEAFPELGLRERASLVLLAGGWRPAFVDELDALALREPFGRLRRNVPGLYAFEMDVAPLLRALAATD